MMKHNEEIFEEIYAIAPKWRELVSNREGELLEQGVSLSLCSDSVDIFNATWCPDCERETVELIALLLVNTTPIKINVHSFEDRESYREKKKEGSLPIKCLPTFIFKEEGKEVGRIEEGSNNKLLEFLQSI